MGQHVFAEVALAAVGAGVGVVALRIAILPAGDVLRRPDCDIVGPAEGIVVAAGIGHGRLSALEAACEERREEEEGDVGPCGVRSHAQIPLG